MDTRVHVATIRLPNASSRQLINQAVPGSETTDLFHSRAPSVISA